MASKLIEDMTKSIIQTLQKNQKRRKKMKDGKLVSVEEIEFVQEKQSSFDKNLQANFKEITENLQEKNYSETIYSKEYIDGLNKYLDEVLRKANLIEIRNKVLEDEKSEYDLKLKGF
jgi:hypothetical protein